jgi:hypothetical protein
VRCDGRSVASTDPLRLTIELDLAGESIQGHLESGDGSPQPFWGWLALVSAIESARDRALLIDAAPPAHNHPKEGSP